MWCLAHQEIEPPRGEDGERGRRKGLYDDFRISRCLRRRIELFFAELPPPLQISSGQHRVLSCPLAENCGPQFTNRPGCK